MSVIISDRDGTTYEYGDHTANKVNGRLGHAYWHVAEGAAAA